MRERVCMCVCWLCDVCSGPRLNKREYVCVCVYVCCCELPAKEDESVRVPVNNSLVLVLPLLSDALCTDHWWVPREVCGGRG